MTRKYLIDEKLETAKNEIVKLIEVHSTDSFKVHLSQIFLIRNVDKCCGYYRDHHFSIWFMYTGVDRANFFQLNFFVLMLSIPSLQELSPHSKIIII